MDVDRLAEVKSGLSSVDFLAEPAEGLELGSGEDAKVLGQPGHELAIDIRADDEISFIVLTGSSDGSGAGGGGLIEAEGAVDHGGGEAAAEVEVTAAREREGEIGPDLEAVEGGRQTAVPGDRGAEGADVAGGRRFGQDDIWGVESAGEGGGRRGEWRCAARISVGQEID